MRDTDKVLVVVPAHAYHLLPEGVFPDDDGADSLFDQKVDDALAGSVQVVVDLPVALVGDALHLLRGTVSFLFRKAQY